MRISVFLFVLLGCIYTCFGIAASIERSMVIVVPSYNNSRWYTWNLDSIFIQQYRNYRVIYIDDCSADGTYDLVKAYVYEQHQENRVTLIHNKERRRALANLYEAIHSCQDTDIIVIVDGDDRLAHTQVLARINKAYEDPRIWLTYGQFREYPTGIIGFCEPMPPLVVARNEFRYHNMTPSHLRTFYAGLFKKIHKKDLLYNNDFFPMAYDLAMMFPMIEMASNDHFMFIPDILLEYNVSNPINDHKISKELQLRCDVVIRHRQRYNPIHTPFNDSARAFVCKRLHMQRLIKKRAMRK